MVHTNYKAVRPAPCEVAPCCWSVMPSGKYLHSFYSHVNSAAHLAQHFRVNARDVIHEARQWQIAAALSDGEEVR